MGSSGCEGHSLVDWTDTWCCLIGWLVGHSTLVCECVCGFVVSVCVFGSFCLLVCVGLFFFERSDCPTYINKQETEFQHACARGAIPCGKPLHRVGATKHFVQFSLSPVAAPKWVKIFRRAETSSRTGFKKMTASSAYSESRILANRPRSGERTPSCVANSNTFCSASMARMKR